MNIVQLKKKIKENGFKFVLKKPYYLFSLPFLFLHILRNRWQYNETTLYLLEMELSQKNVKKEIKIKKTYDIKEIIHFAKLREQEDSEWQVGYYTKEVSKRIANGDWCFVAYNDNTVHSFLFVSRGPCYLSPVGILIELPHHTIAIYDVYTFEKYRGQGIYREIFNYCVNDCWKQGFKKAWLWLMKHNEISIIVHDKLGMNHIFEKISLHQRFGLKWIKKEKTNIKVSELLNE